MWKTTKRNPKSLTHRKVHLDLGLLQQTLPNRTGITNPTETSPAETFKGVISKEGIPLETSLVETFKEETYRERTPQGSTRDTHNKETTMTLTTKETITQETAIETNPHGMTIAKEIIENNPPGEVKEEATH